MKTIKDMKNVKYPIQPKFDQAWEKFTNKAKKLYRCSIEDITVFYEAVWVEFQRRINKRAKDKTITTAYIDSVVERLADRKLVIRLIQEGNGQVLYSFSARYYERFARKGIQNFGCPLETAEELFQDILLDFWRSIITGRLVILETDVENYLYGTLYRRKLINWYNKNKKWYQKKKEISEELGLSVEPSMNWEELTYNQEKAQSAMKQMGEKCREVLKLFYYEGYAMESIARELGYSNHRVAITKKNKCLNTLIKKIKSI